MENAQLIGLSRQIALQRQMDVVANNMANINTSGFKAEALLFEEYVMPVAADRDFPMTDQSLSYTQDWATVHNFTAGAIVQTGNPTDVALEGDGFLAVMTPNGERYTKDGSLKIDNIGRLVTSSGYPVLSEGGEITIGRGETNLTITEDGQVTTSGGDKGRLRVVRFENPQELTLEGGNLFAGTNPINDLTTLTHQGAIEKSNVSGVAEMSNMIRVNRAYQSLATLMKQQDDLRQSAIQRLASLNA